MRLKPEKEEQGKMEDSPKLWSTLINEVENLHLDLEVEKRSNNENGDCDGDWQSLEVQNPLMMEDVRPTQNQTKPKSVKKYGNSILSKFCLSYSMFLFLFFNDQILDSVFPYLDMQSLKTVRQVNKIWAKSAMTRIFDRGVLFHVRSNFYHQSKEKQDVELSALKKVLGSFLTSSGRRFPGGKPKHIGAKLKSVGLLDQRDIQVLRFLGVLGSNVENFALAFSNFQTQHAELIKSDLSSLTRLTNTGSFEINVHSMFMTTISSLNRPLIISGLTFEPCDAIGEARLQVLEQFSKGEVKMRKLEFRSTSYTSSFESPEIAKILRQFLLNNRDTLEEIDFDFCPGLLPFIEFPVVLPNVTKFVCSIHPYVGIGFGVTHPLFLQLGVLMTHDFQFMKHLPNLSQVELLCDGPEKMLRVMRDIWRVSLGHAGIAPNVKIVQCHNDRIINTEVLSTIFPNAKINVSYIIRTEPVTLAML